MLVRGVQNKASVTPGIAASVQQVVALEVPGYPHLGLPRRWIWLSVLLSCLLRSRPPPGVGSLENSAERLVLLIDWSTVALGDRRPFACVLMRSAISSEHQKGLAFGGFTGHPFTIDRCLIMHWTEHGACFRRRLQKQMVQDSFLFA